MNEVTEKIYKLINKRGWSPYRVEQETDISAPTIRRWKDPKMYPTMPNFLQFCKAFGITPAEFFLDGEMVELNNERKRIFGYWEKLTPNQRDAVETILKSYVDA